MNQVTDQQIIEILKKEAIPALGCTEPVACALACAKCKEVLGGVPENLDVLVSGNIYKNGMGVGIPEQEWWDCLLQQLRSCLWKIRIRVGSAERGERGG